MKLWKDIKDQHGIEAMRSKWIEELTELSLALQHYDKIPVRDIQKEIADVEICLDQMKDLVYGHSSIDGIRNKIIK